MYFPLQALLGFVSAASVKINPHRTCTQLCAIPPDQAGIDAARKALEQAAKLRQEVADLEKEVAKGLCRVDLPNTATVLLKYSSSMQPESVSRFKKRRRICEAQVRIMIHIIHM